MRFDYLSKKEKISILKKNLKGLSEFLLSEIIKNSRKKIKDKLNEKNHKNCVVYSHLPFYQIIFLDYYFIFDEDYGKCRVLELQFSENIPSELAGFRWSAITRRPKIKSETTHEIGINFPIQDQSFWPKLNEILAESSFLVKNLLNKKYFVDS